MWLFVVHVLSLYRVGFYLLLCEASIAFVKYKRTLREPASLRLADFIFDVR